MEQSEFIFDDNFRTDRNFFDPVKLSDRKSYQIVSDDESKMRPNIK